MARPDGEMAPVKVMCPEPLANTLCIAVLFESRDFTAASFPRSAGECRNNGATRSLESALASSDRGSTASVGPGSTSAMYPRKFTITLVLSIWAADISTTCLHGWLGLRTSIGSRWYGRVCHWPRSADPEPVSTTFSSAHCETEISRGGSNASAPTWYIENGVVISNRRPRWLSPSCGAARSFRPRVSGESPLPFSRRLPAAPRDPDMPTAHRRQSRTNAPHTRRPW